MRSYCEGRTVTITLKEHYFGLHKAGICVMKITNAIKKGNNTIYHFATNEPISVRFTGTEAVSVGKLVQNF